ncbi:uncharacterized protein C2orf72 homolog [Heterodontus francisci]|uniref:uncharacterized protein C2orf72 homolog n=1 Tax=Heterodontus francisci TaxID=7792 RepID=UPI00355AE352
MGQKGNKMGLIERLAQLFSFGSVAISQTDLLTEYQPVERRPRAPGALWMSEAGCVAMEEMADHSLEDIAEGVEEDFQLLVRRLGGRESILLVGDVCTDSKGPGRGMLCREMAQELFAGSEGVLSERAAPDEESEQEDRSRVAAQTDKLGPPRCLVSRPESRGVTARLILFVFRLECLKSRESRVAVREILKDVRKRCQAFKPTVLGLIYCESDCPEMGDCLTQLSHYMTEVFHIPSERAVTCVSPYVKSRSNSIINIKRKICDLLRSSNTVYRPCVKRTMGVKVLKCFPWYSRRKERSKLTKSQSLEVPMASTEMISQSKGSSQGQCQNNCAYYSEKTRLSFRHELNSAASVINSTI